MHEIIKLSFQFIWYYSSWRFVEVLRQKISSENVEI